MEVANIIPVVYDLTNKTREHWNIDAHTVEYVQQPSMSAEQLGSIASLRGSSRSAQEALLCSGI